MFGRIHQRLKTRGKTTNLVSRLHGIPAHGRGPTRDIASLASVVPTTQCHRHAHRSTLREVHPRQLYEIINDVDRYHQFLPYCHESRVLRVAEATQLDGDMAAECGTMYDAILGVGLPLDLTERYISRVRALPPSADDVAPPMWTVEAKSIRSRLFDSLKSRWQLTHAHAHKNAQDTRHLDENGADDAIGHVACRVDFEVEIRVSNPLISLTLDQVLRNVAREQVEAFERRCHEIPGRRH